MPALDHTILDDLVAEQDRLAGVLAGLDDAQWSAPSGAAGWSVADVVLHLAQSEEFVLGALTGMAPGPFGAPAVTPSSGPGAEAPIGDGGIDAVMESLVRAQRAAPVAVFRRWESARRAAVAALRAADPAVAVPWAATPLRPRTLATTRLAETWAHALDVAAPFGLALADTARLRHVAWLAHRSLPYAFGLVGESAPEVRCTLTGPDGEVWELGPAGAGSTITGPAGDFCRVGARRLRPDDSRLQVTGPRGRLALDLLRNYAA